MADTDSCVIGVPMNSLTDLQEQLLESKMQGDYYAIESVFKGNFLMKDDMRRGSTGQHVVTRQE